MRFRPFTGDSTRTVRLDVAPLALVLAQIRWPPHSALTRQFRDSALEFGAGLDGFPLYSEMTAQEIQFTSDGVKSVPGEPVYQWKSADGIWTVSLTRTFASIYCSHHDGYRYTEMEGHIDQVCERLGTSLGIVAINRVGLRYVNRITDSTTMDELGQTFDPAVLGYSQLSIPSEVALAADVSQGEYSIEDITLHVRSGHLPPNQTLDPAIPDVDCVSWTLDMDASIDHPQAFDALAVRSTASKLADTIYDFFKLVLKEGGEQKLDGSR